MHSSLNHLDISLLTALNAANLNFTPSALARKGSDSSLSTTFSHLSLAQQGDEVDEEEDFSSHHHALFRSLHDLKTHWREHAWAHIPHRHERIAMGHAPTPKRILRWEEMREEIGRIPGLGWVGCLPVAEVEDHVVGWRIKGATW